MKKRILAAVLLMSVSICAFAGCGAKTETKTVDLTSVDLDTIIEKAKEEGSISSVGMPDDWANWKGSWETISSTYGIAHDDTDMSSAEELSMFETEKDAPTKDIGDVGQAFGKTAIEMDVVQPYKATTWDSVPDWAKDPDGNWVITYYGTLSCLTNTDNVGSAITSWEDVKNSDAVLTIGDVVRGASAQMTVLSAAYALGGDMKNLDPAFELFAELAKEGRLDAAEYSAERMSRGEIDTLFTWDYNVLKYRDLALEDNPNMNLECHVMEDGAIQSGYCLVINKYAPHPYSAALTLEYMLSDEGQINRAEGYARPIREDVEIPAELTEKMIDDAEYTNGIPISDNEALTTACTEIAERWEEEIIPWMN
ncbi:MAG: extracellular solute-binding protein [Lachnospiraceae bacterium]|nr:extracellular solute-binding protein [Lachnospiraceae bacterium]